MLHIVYMLLVSVELMRGGSDPEEEEAAVALACEVGAMLQEDDDGVLAGVLQAGDPIELLQVVAGGCPPPPPAPIGPPPALIGRLGPPPPGPM